MIFTSKLGRVFTGACGDICYQARKENHLCRSATKEEGVAPVFSVFSPLSLKEKRMFFQ